MIVMSCFQQKESGIMANSDWNYEELPKENKEVMIDISKLILEKFINKEEVIKDINTAKRCMDYQHIICNNKGCLNLMCPLNKKYRTKYKKEIDKSEEAVEESSKRVKKIMKKLKRF